MTRRPDKRIFTLRRVRTALALVFLACAGALICYAALWFRAEKTGERLRETYYASPGPSASVSASVIPVSVIPVSVIPASVPASVSAAPAEGGRVKDYPALTPAPEGAAETKEGMENLPVAAPATQIPRVTALPAGERLPEAPYPGNPHGAVSSRFAALLKQNPDIVGWLTVEGLIDTAVVRRDNVYYLTHDALGNGNENGAVFMEEIISLRTRPYTLILYGHNMKTGAVFGGLRNYESLAWLREHPLIRFSTLYEEGTYAVAAVAAISLEKGARNALDLSRLNSATVSWRREEIRKALSLSMYTRTVDVEPTDQLLLLVTCSGDEKGRRMVLARRLRDGETEEWIAARVRLCEIR